MSPRRTSACTSAGDSGGAEVYPWVHVFQVLEGVWGNPDPSLPEEWPSEIAGESMDTHRTVVRPPPFVQVPLG